MRTRCRLGIHEWSHLGYHLYRDVSFGGSVIMHRTYRYCVECGKRRKDRDREGCPPEIEQLADDTYIDHSRPRWARR